MTQPTTALPPARPLPRAAWGHLLLAEMRMILRDTAGLVVPVGFPTLLLVMNGVGQDTEQVLPNGSTVMATYVLPMTLTMVVALVGVVNMPSFLSSYRKYGVLRRLGVTPVNPAAILVAQMLASLIQVLLGLGLMLGLGALFFGAGLPAALGWALLVGILLVGAMYGVGILIAAVGPTVNSALAIGLLVFFAMMALGGGLGSLETMPDVVQTIGSLQPYGVGIDALSAAWIGERPDVADLAVLGGWAVGTGGLALRFFRWS